MIAAASPHANYRVCPAITRSRFSSNCQHLMFAFALPFRFVQW